jgi:hypothetical protein
MGRETQADGTRGVPATSGQTERGRESVTATSLASEGAWDYHLFVNDQQPGWSQRISSRDHGDLG